MFRYVLLALKGCAMGMADVVPGVSGGTIAFISGIYSELIELIKSFNPTALKLLGRFEFRKFWRHINGSFLFSVLLGIGIAIFSLARAMTYLLAHHPIEIWAFFFGLIVASAAVRRAGTFGSWNAASVATGTACAAPRWRAGSRSPPRRRRPTTGGLFMLSGAVAICAMILPGHIRRLHPAAAGKIPVHSHRPFQSNSGIGVLAAVRSRGRSPVSVSFSHLLSWLLRQVITT